MIPSKDEQSAPPHEVSGSVQEPPPPPAEASGGSIDKVRDLLFGSQLRELDRRFVRLEERLARDTGQLRGDLQVRLEALESYVRKETGSLADQLRAEHENFVEAHGSLARDLSETAKHLERRTTAVDEQSARGQRELRQQLLEQHQRLTEDLRRRADDLLATVTREAQALRTDKTDRSALAAMLNEMAMRLTDELRAADAEDGGNG